MKISSNQTPNCDVLSNPEKLIIVVGILRIVTAKITGITPAELILRGILESFLPWNLAPPDLFEYWIGILRFADCINVTKKITNT